MNPNGTAVSRRTRTTALVVATAAVVTGVVWSTSSGTTGTTSTGITSTVVDSSLAQLAATAPLALDGTESHPVPGWMPPELRADLRRLRTMEPEQRRAAATRIWRDALAGEYGPRVRVRATGAQRRFETLPQELRDDLKDLRSLDAGEARDELREIRDKALDGAYGDQVQRWAERRADLWKQD